MGEFIIGRQMNLRDWYLKDKLIKRLFVSVAVEIHFYIFLLCYQYFDIFSEETLFKWNLLKLSHKMLYMNVAIDWLIDFNAQYVCLTRLTNDNNLLMSST